MKNFDPNIKNDEKSYKNILFTKLDVRRFEICNNM